MTWAALFERAGAYERTVSDVCDALATRRESHSCDDNDREDPGRD
jgi:hypothetical protein